MGGRLFGLSKLRVSGVLLLMTMAGPVQAVAEAVDDRHTHREHLMELVQSSVGWPGAEGLGEGVRFLVLLASDGPELSDEIKTLLVRATAAPDPEVARLAEVTLFNLLHREAPNATVPDAERWRDEQRRFLRSLEVTGVLGSSDPAAVLGHLARLASQTPELHDEIRPLVEEAESRGGPELVAMSRRILAIVDRRPKTPRAPGTPLQADATLHQIVEELGDPEPRIRAGAIGRFYDWAVDGAWGEHPALVEVLRLLTEDPDARVRAQARYALAGLGGDKIGAAGVTSDRSERR